MPVGTALAIAGAGVGSAVIGSSAAKSAANTQAAAANQATAAQTDIYNSNKALLSPFVQQGSDAGSALQKLLGIGAAPAPAMPQVGDLNTPAWLKANPDVEQYYNQTPAAQTVSLDQFAQNVAQQQGNVRSAIPTYTSQDIANYQAPPSSQEAALQALPGYQFTRDQGIASVNRSLGSMGLTGAQAKGISRFVTGLADSTYNSQAQNLQNATNTGESAGAATAGVGAQTGSGIANTIVGAGTANAAGTVGSANAVTGGLSSIPGALLTNSILNGSGSSGGGGGGIYAALPGNSNIFTGGGPY